MSAKFPDTKSHELADNKSACRPEALFFFNPLACHVEASLCKKEGHHLMTSEPASRQERLKSASRAGRERVKKRRRRAVPQRRPWFVFSMHLSEKMCMQVVFFFSSHVSARVAETSRNSTINNIQLCKQNFGQLFPYESKIVYPFN